MNTIQDLIGRQEDYHLELKSRDVLRGKGRLPIGREVVAMLNADGGDVWIGVAEQGGRAVAIEPIADVERERGSLQDYLMDVVEPAPTHDEVQVEVVGKVLRIRIQSHARRGPYGLKGKAGAIYFPVRVADRIRPMTRDEQRTAFLGDSRPADPVRDALRRVLDERSRLQEEGRASVSLRVVPVPEIPLSDRTNRVMELLQNPELSGDRRSSGWTIANPYVLPEQHGDGRVTSRWPRSPLEAEDWYRVEVRPDGAIHYEAGLERFSYHGARGLQRGDDEAPELWPLAIAELPVSAMRLAATLFAGRQEDGASVIADLAIFGLQGWKLRPGSPRFLGHRVIWDFPEAAVFDERDLLLTEPLMFSDTEVQANPDRCGYRLVRQVYREFGYGEEAISVDLFDAKSGQLLLAS